MTPSPYRCVYVCVRVRGFRLSLYHHPGRLVALLVFGWSLRNTVRDSVEVVGTGGVVLCAAAATGVGVGHYYCGAPPRHVSRARDAKFVLLVHVDQGQTRPAVGRYGVDCGSEFGFDFGFGFELLNTGWPSAVFGADHPRRGAAPQESQGGQLQDRTPHGSSPLHRASAGEQRYTFGVGAVVVVVVVAMVVVATGG